MRATPEMLLQRLDAIGESLARSGRALALIGVGSVGTDTARLDRYSDLDFFVIAGDDDVSALIGDLGWLSNVAPLAFQFRNTVDGHKFFFDDDIYGEFAVFSPTRILSIPREGERVVWSADGFDPTGLDRKVPSAPTWTPEFAMGELITNLYVGLTRYARGEKLSAFRFVQVFAVDQLARLLSIRHGALGERPDPYDLTRRMERRAGIDRAVLAGCMQGYDRTVESALAILKEAEGLGVVDSYVKGRILMAAEVASRGV